MNRKDKINIIKEKIKLRKPKISLSSLNTYSQLLYTLFYKLYNEYTPFEFDTFDQQINVLKFLENYKPTTRKTILSALISITDKNDYYKKVMTNDISTDKGNIELNMKSEQQQKNWVLYDQIRKVYDKLKKQVNFILDNLLENEELTMKEYLIFQNLIIVSLVTGILIPPRRSMDWTEMKIKNIDKSIDNYIDNNKFIFNQYKTKKIYGKQEILIPNVLKLLLNKFEKLSPFEYLLVNNKGEKLTEITLNQYIKKIFNGKGGTSIFRHVYITRLHGIIPNIKDIAQDMGHSLSQQMQYIKK